MVAVHDGGSFGGWDRQSHILHIYQSKIQIHVHIHYSTNRLDESIEMFSFDLMITITTQLQNGDRLTRFATRV
jgi:hypothetical protein